VAKKVRTPTPRPRQQGPQRRDSRPRRGEPFQPFGGLNKRGLLAGIGVGVVVAVIIIVVAVSRGSSGTSAAQAASALQAAGCTFHTYPSEGRSHTTNINADIKYKTFPPTSGTHYYAPAVWNRYTEPLALVQEVHNLEHGGIIIQYGDKVPQPTIGQLTSFYDSSPNAMLLAPLPKLGNKVALTAWTRLASCTTFDQKAYASFRDAFRGKGPERYPVSSLTPGS
jgi:Protein of unknown function (DUF3105)